MHQRNPDHLETYLPTFSFNKSRYFNTGTLPGMLASYCYSASVLFFTNFFKFHVWQSVSSEDHNITLCEIFKPIEIKNLFFRARVESKFLLKEKHYLICNITKKNLIFFSLNLQSRRNKLFIMLKIFSFYHCILDFISWITAS